MLEAFGCSRMFFYNAETYLSYLRVTALAGTSLCLIQ